ncbi:MAG: acyl transferase [Bacteroidetes bacterium]|nr:acyl transferase [Bacteroidota bacterium]
MTPSQTPTTIRDYPALLDQDLAPNSSRFNDLALELFRFQAQANPLYARFLKGIGCVPEAVSDVQAIPALPIAFFRTHTVLTAPWVAATGVSGEGVADTGVSGEGVAALPGRGITFTSSGSTSATASRHYVPDPARYEDAFLRGFQRAYGNPASWTFLFLLPAYLEREGSSLIYMCRELAARSLQPETGFFLHDHEALLQRAVASLARRQPTMLLGVSFALLDLAEQMGADSPANSKLTHFSLLNSDLLTVVETGGMKGRRREMLREELHATLCAGLGVSAIHSEYGMTELLSQAWSRGQGRFTCPPWMRVRLRDLNDPLSAAAAGSVGALDVLDLANGHSCAFIATDDLGRMHPDASFEVLGRLDASDVRGCNLLVS